MSSTMYDNLWRRLVLKSRLNFNILSLKFSKLEQNPMFNHELHNKNKEPIYDTSEQICNKLQVYRLQLKLLFQLNQNCLTR